MRNVAVRPAYSFGNVARFLESSCVEHRDCVARFRPSRPIIVMYIHGIGRMLALPNSARCHADAFCAPSLPAHTYRGET